MSKGRMPTPLPESFVDAIADGRELFVREWVRSDPRSRGGDGLGRWANDTACAACHSAGGVGGAGRNVQPVFLALLSTRAFDLFAGTGRSTTGTSSNLQTPALFGAGLIDDIDVQALFAAAETSYPADPEVTGRLGTTATGGVGRFGWKGDVDTLHGFVAKACEAELGLTVAEPIGQVDLDRTQLASLVAFVRDLPAPVEKEEPEAEAGRAVFHDVGCATCHTPMLGDVAGLYSDLLLHDMGAALDSGGGGYYGMETTTASREWRTPPLWGLADSGPYLHDGRAETVDDAIDAHGGEARVIVRRWRALSEEDQGALRGFLRSLRAPPTL